MTVSSVAISSENRSRGPLSAAPSSASTDLSEVVPTLQTMRRSSRTHRCNPTCKKGDSSSSRAAAVRAQNPFRAAKASVSLAVGKLARRRSPISGSDFARPSSARKMFTKVLCDLRSSASAIRVSRSSREPCMGVPKSVA